MITNVLPPFLWFTVYMRTDVCETYLSIPVRDSCFHLGLYLHMCTSIAYMWTIHATHDLTPYYTLLLGATDPFCWTWCIRCIIGEYDADNKKWWRWSLITVDRWARSQPERRSEAASKCRQGNVQRPGHISHGWSSRWARHERWSTTVWTMSFVPRQRTTKNRRLRHTSYTGLMMMMMMMMMKTYS